MRKTTSRPFVTLKFAQTLDGRIATRTGDSKWISSPESRQLAHRLRSQHDAVLVGVNTVLKDNPRLDVRLVKGKNPVKVILDSQLRTPLKAKLLQRRAKNTIVAVTKKAGLQRVKQFEKLGVKVLIVASDKNGQVDLKQLLLQLREMGIKKLLVEGGGKIITSFLRQRLADRMVVITAPKIIGQGIDSVANFLGKSPRRLRLTPVKISRSGGDIVIDGNLRE